MLSGLSRFSGYPPAWQKTHDKSLRTLWWAFRRWLEVGPGISLITRYERRASTYRAPQQYPTAPILPLGSYQYLLGCRGKLLTFEDHPWYLQRIYWGVAWPLSALASLEARTENIRASRWLLSHGSKSSDVMVVSPFHLSWFDSGLSKGGYQLRNLDSLSHNDSEGDHLPTNLVRPLWTPLGPTHQLLIDYGCILVQRHWSGVLSCWNSRYHLLVLRGDWRCMSVNHVDPGIDPEVFEYFLVSLLLADLRLPCCVEQAYELLHSRISRWSVPSSCPSVWWSTFHRLPNNVEDREQGLVHKQWAGYQPWESHLFRMKIAGRGRW